MASTKPLSDFRNSKCSRRKKVIQTLLPIRLMQLESKGMKDLMVAAQSAALNRKEVMKLFTTDLSLSLFNMDRKEHKTKTLQF